MRISRNLPLTILFTVMMIVIIAFCVTETVISQSNEARCMEEKYYDELEADYLAEIKLILTSEGYRNSGVTMTRVTEADGMRSYTVNIHHKLIDKLSTDEQEQLEEMLGEIPFPDISCSFCHKFL